MSASNIKLKLKFVKFTTTLSVTDIDGNEKFYEFDQANEMNDFLNKIISEAGVIQITSDKTINITEGN